MLLDTVIAMCLISTMEPQARESYISRLAKRAANEHRRPTWGMRLHTFLTGE